MDLLNRQAGVSVSLSNFIKYLIGPSSKRTGNAAGKRGGEWPLPLRKRCIFQLGSMIAKELSLLLPRRTSAKDTTMDEQMIRELSNKEILDAYYRHRDDYTAEAQSLLLDEIRKRNLSESSVQENPEEVEKAAVADLKSEDFVLIEHTFTPIDLLLASAILRDNAIPFFPENITASSAIPIESEGTRRITIRIHKDYIDKSRELLGEHFAVVEDRYTLKHEGVRERLRTFNFHDIQYSEHSLSEEVEVALTSEEKAVVAGLGRRLQQEAESFEKTEERILFFYDSIDDLLGRLEKRGEALLTLNDLLTMLEIMQVYIDDPALPTSMDDAIAQLLAFFLKTS